MYGRVLKILFLLLAAAFLVSSGAGAEVGGGQATVTLDLSPVTPTPTPTVTPTPSSSTLFVSADDAVKERGYTVNGVANATSVPISTAGQDIVIIPTALPQGMLMNFTFSYLGFSASMVHSSFNERFPRHNEPITLSVHLSLEPITPVDPTPTPTVTPTHGPDTPSDPDRPTPVPTATPTVTPGPTVSPTQSPTEPSDSDDDDPFFPIPGSDEPLFPILPPAGSVHSIAGFIPLAAGILLLFLVFFWRRKVYRILKHHAKQYGEKPDKDQLKATADAVIWVIRSDEYAGWRTDSVLTARLSAEIIRILDEMQYPSVIPREPVVAEIIKSAKSKINRHRL